MDWDTEYDGIQYVILIYSALFVREKNKIQLKFDFSNIAIFLIIIGSSIPDKE